MGSKKIKFMQKIRLKNAAFILFIIGRAAIKDIIKFIFVVPLLS